MTAKRTWSTRPSRYLLIAAVKQHVTKSPMIVRRDLRSFLIDWGLDGISRVSARLDGQARISPKALRTEELLLQKSRFGNAAVEFHLESILQLPTSFMLYAY